MVKGIRNIYIFLTVFILLSVSVTTLTFFDVMPAVLLMWLCFMFFAFGYKVHGKGTKFDECQKEEKNLFVFFHKKKLLTIVICFSFAILYAYFYTGNHPLTVFRAAFGGYSLYFDYQNYFKESGLSAFSLSKIPYILMNVIHSLLVITGIVYSLTNDKKIRLKNFSYSFFLALSLLYIGVARGTNFELFELLCIFYYTILLRLRRRKLNFKVILIVLLAVALGFFVFSTTMSKRGFSGFYITDDIKYDPNSLFSRLFPSLSMMISQLTCYFGFGFRFTSYFLSDYLSNDTFLFSSLIPGGFKIIGHDPIADIVGQISCGTNWRPDIVYFIGQLGFVGVFLALFICGRASSYFYRQGSSIFKIFNYLIMLQMFSLPIANFIRISSTNILILFLCVMCFVVNVVFKRNKNTESFFKRQIYVKN